MIKRISVTLIMKITDIDVKAIMNIAAGSTLKHWNIKISDQEDVPNISVTEAQLNAITNDIAFGGHIKIRSRISNEIYTLTCDKLVQGIERYLDTPTDGEFLKLEDNKLGININLLNTDIVDSILQYAMYGKIFYRDGIRI